MNKINYICLFLTLGILTSSEAQNEKTGDLYTRVVPDTYENDLFYGKVKSVKKFVDFIYMSKLEEDLWKNKYETAFGNGKIKGLYTSFNRYGKTTGRYKLNDSINELVIDTLKSSPFNRAFIYKDLQNKIKYKTKWQLPIRVYNPYQVSLNRYTYRTYDYKVLKDSSYKQTNTSYEYILDNEDNTKIVEELTFTEYDMDLDGVVEERRPDQHNFYEYDEKGRIISKTYTFPHYEKYRSTTPRYSCIDGCMHSIPRYRTSKKIFIYDDQDHLLSYTLRVRGIAYKEEYTYKDGVLIIKDRYWPRPFTDTFPFVKLHERFYYNEKSAVTSKEGINKDGSIDYKLNFTYEYDEKGNWIERKSYLEGDSIMGTDPFVIAKRIIEYYTE